jgi:hypothetical protein
MSGNICEEFRKETQAVYLGKKRKESQRKLKYP